MSPSGLWTLQERFSLLVEIGRLVVEVAETDIDQVLEKILEAVCAVTRAEGGSVFFVDYPDNELILLQGVGLPPAEHAVLHRQVDSAPFAPLDETAGPADLQSVRTPDGRTLTSVPLRVGSTKMGVLCLVNTGPLSLEGDDAALVSALARQAALAIDRSGCRESVEVSHAFANVFRASQLISTAVEADSLRQVIADNALRVSRADFVVLYEYFEEKKDVRVPPVIAGEMKASAILSGRSEVIDHRSSAVFRILEHDKPFYAPQGYEDWRDGELLDEAVNEGSFFKREGVLSSAGIPLRIDAERVGVLFFNYRSEVAFSRRLQERLELFSNQAALALGNARFFQRSESYSQKLKLLQEIGRELSMAVDLGTPEILGALDEQVRRLIPSENFLLCLYDEVNDRLELPYLRDEQDPRETLLPGLNQGLAAYVRRSGQPLLARQDEIEALIACGEAERVGTPAKVWLGAPLISRQKVLGVLVVQDYDDADAFDAEDLELLFLIGSQAAVAIDNHRLFAGYKLQVKELRALLELSQQIGAGRLALATLLSSVLDRICRLASCQSGLLFLREPGRADELRVVAVSGDSSAFLDKTLKLGEGLAGRIAEDGVSRFENRYFEWEGRSALFDKARRVCGAPLYWKDHVIGVLSLAGRDPEGKFSDRDLRLLERFAGPLAIAIRNALDSSFRRCLVHSSPHAIVAVDAEGRLTELSETAEKLFKYSRQELVGEMVRTLFWGDKEDREKFGDQIQKVGHFEGTLFGKTKTGEKIPLAISAALLRDQDGEVLGSMGTVEDLRLGSLRGRARDLVKALGEINLAQDLDKLLDLIVFYACDLLYGDAGCLFVKEGDTHKVRAPHGVEDEFLEELQSPSAQNLLEEFARQERVGKPLSVELLGCLRLERKSRSAIPAPIRVADRSLALLWIESRETEHFREDQELLQALVDQAAQSINRLQLLQEREKTVRGLVVSSNAISVGQIATSFFHEAKNSMNVMTLTVTNLQDELKSEGSLRGNYADRLGNVLYEMTRLNALAIRLQHFTQQGLQPNKKEVYFNDIVEKTMELLESTLQNKHLKWEPHLEMKLDRPRNGKGTPVRIDEAQLQQVFMNLILNAVAASPARGKLFVETRDHLQQVEFRITDQGRGIPEDKRKQIFEPFFTTKKEGTGLGLYISKILVEENHRGSIEVTTIPGKGSTFSVFLPKSN